MIKFDKAKGVYHANADLMDSIKEIGRDYGLQSGQLMVVAFLGDESTSVNRLRRDMRGPSNLSYTLRALETRQLVTLTRNELDGRAKIVTLTKEGLALCARLRHHMEEHCSALESAA